MIQENQVPVFIENYFKDKSLSFYSFDNCLISNIIKDKKVWEPHLHKIFEKYITENSVVIECGCHIGTHTVVLSSLCSKIYGFEPMPQTHMLLMKNIELNNIKNAVIYKKGVSNKEGFTKYAWTEHGNIGASSLDDNPMGKPPNHSYVIDCRDISSSIELTTVDSMELDKLDFMKIDVEGYETLVIEGAMNTIIKFKPVIVMEVWKDHNGNVDLDYTKQLYSNLIDIGYSIEHIEGPDFICIPN